MLSDPLGIITSAYFFVCKIGIIVRWVYICELMLLNFHAKDKCSIPMGEVPYIVSAILTNRFAQLPRQYYQLITAQKTWFSKKPYKGLDFLIYKGLFNNYSLNPNGL